MIFPPAAAEAHARVRVKICGLTNPADAELAVELGADALGLNFHPGSPRCLETGRGSEWVRALPARVRRVAVVVNPTLEMIRRLLSEGLADAFQLHGDENEAFCVALAAEGISFAKAIRVRSAADLLNTARFRTPAFVLDAFQAGRYGGTGQTIDWTLAAQFVAAQRAAGCMTVLSGGLTPQNVFAAIDQVHPFGVDVASGVEAPGKPRRKDAARLKEFFDAVRAANGLPR